MYRYVPSSELGLEEKLSTTAYSVGRLVDSERQPCEQGREEAGRHDADWFQMPAAVRPISLPSGSSLTPEALDLPPSLTPDK